MKRKKYKPLEGNIKNEKAFDPFPHSGPIKEHERLIRKRVRLFLASYTWLDPNEVLAEGVKLARQALAHYDPDKGKFATLLLWYLKGLHRAFLDSTRAEPIDDIPEHEREKPRPAAFLSGYNGARAVLDRQWLSGTEKRERVKIGVQLRNSDVGHADGVVSRISDALSVLLKGKPSPRFAKQLEAVIDHLERRQREADEEAERQRYGNFDPAHLEAQRLKADVGFYKGRTPPRFGAKNSEMSTLAGLHAFDEGLKETHGGVMTPPPNRRFARVKRGISGTQLEAWEEELEWRAAALRPSLTIRELPFLERILDAARGGGLQSLGELAVQLGISKGYASKLNNRVVEKLKTKLTREQWEAILNNFGPTPPK